VDKGLTDLLATWAKEAGTHPAHLGLPEVGRLFAGIGPKHVAHPDGARYALGLQPNEKQPKLALRHLGSNIKGRTQYPDIMLGTLGAEPDPQQKLAAAMKLLFEDSTKVLEEAMALVEPPEPKVKKETPPSSEGKKTRRDSWREQQQRKKLKEDKAQAAVQSQIPPKVTLTFNG
jgi:hypothetical protein